MKICSKCKISKEPEEFSKRKESKDGLTNWCKECVNINYQTYYINTKKERLQKQKDYRYDVRRFIDSIKNQLYCLKCNENRIYCLNFHHLDPNEKKFQISNCHLFTKNHNKIINEMKKCIPLCSNCHDEFHYLEKKEGIIITKYIEDNIIIIYNNLFKKIINMNLVPI